MNTPVTTPSIGRPMRRTEDPPLLMGRGKYAADVRLPGLLQAAVLRSPHAHARLGAIRAKAALALSGVHAVITGEDLAAIGRIPTRLGHRIGHPECLQFPLTRDRVRYVGEPVAVVIADSRYLAEDALELIDVDYAPLPTVADARRALAYLVDVVGADRVLLGSDHPFWMGDPEPLTIVREAGLAVEAQRAVLGDNARRLFKLSGDTPR